MKTMQIGLYARVSSERQAQEGTIDSQVAAIRDYVTEAGGRIEPDMTFIDNGISGATLIRPALDALRDKAAAGEIDRVYILSPDRLARKYAHQLLLIEEFKKLNVQVAFTNKTISETPEDQMLLQIQGVISEYEREKIMERSRRGKLHAAKKGRVCVLSGAPFGYVYVKATDDAEAYYQIDETEAGVVKEAFDLYCNNLQSIGEIGRLFTKKKYRTRTGRFFWERSVIWGMLRNPAYSGLAGFRKTMLVPRIRATKLARDNSYYPKRSNSSSRARPKEEWISIPVPQIIAPQLFASAAERLKENIKLSSRNNKKYDYLLSGLIRCQECGYSIYGKPASQTRYKRLYYRCMGQDGSRWPGGRVCSGHPVRVEVLDELVWEQVKRLIATPETVLSEYEDRIEKKKVKSANGVDLIGSKNRELKKLDTQKERLLDLYQRGDLALTEMEPRLKALRSRVNKTEAEINLLKKNVDQKARQLHLVSRFEDFSAKLKNNLQDISFEDKKRIVRLLVTDVIVDTTKEELHLKHILPLKKSCPLRSGGTYCSLWCSTFRIRQFSSLHDASVQPFSDQLPHDSITYPKLDDRPEMASIQSVEKLPYVDLEDPPSSHCHGRIPKIF